MADEERKWAVGEVVWLTLLNDRNNSYRDCGEPREGVVTGLDGPHYVVINNAYGDDETHAQPHEVFATEADAWRAYVSWLEAGLRGYEHALARARTRLAGLLEPGGRQ